jgi:Protein of unknown function (DUF3568)
MGAVVDAQAFAELRSGCAGRTPSDSTTRRHAMFGRAGVFYMQAFFRKERVMKAAYLFVCVIGLGAFLWTVSGCQTETAGAKYTLGAYTAMVDSSPDKVTDAARKAAEDLKLQDVLANSTKVDGNVTAKNADGDTVAIDVEQAGDNVSKVTIHVGATGDEAVSKELMDKINSHLNWF